MHRTISLMNDEHHSVVSCMTFLTAAKDPESGTDVAPFLYKLHDTNNIPVHIKSGTAYRFRPLIATDGTKWERGVSSVYEIMEDQSVTRGTVNPSTQVFMVSHKLDVQYHPSNTHRRFKLQMTLSRIEIASDARLFDAMFRVPGTLKEPYLRFLNPCSSIWNAPKPITEWSRKPSEVNSIKDAIASLKKIGVLDELVQEETIANFSDFDKDIQAEVINALVIVFFGDLLDDVQMNVIHHFLLGNDHIVPVNGIPGSGKTLMVACAIATFIVVAPSTSRLLGTAMSNVAVTAMFTKVDSLFDHFRRCIESTDSSQPPYYHHRSSYWMYKAQQEKSTVHFAIWEHKAVFMTLNTAIRRMERFPLSNFFDKIVIDESSQVLMSPAVNVLLSSLDPGFTVSPSSNRFSSVTDTSSRATPSSSSSSTSGAPSSSVPATASSSSGTTSSTNSSTMIAQPRLVVMFIGDTRQLSPYFELSDLVINRMDTFPILRNLLQRSPLDVAVKLTSPHQLVKSFRLPPKQMKYLRDNEYADQPGLHDAVGLAPTRTHDGETQYLWLTGAGGTESWGTSMYNPGQELTALTILSGILGDMVKSKSAPKEIAILCFYEGQRAHFVETMHCSTMKDLILKEFNNFDETINSITIKTVDSSQGAEFDYTITITSRPSHSLGFLSSSRRSVVSCSRARIANFVVLSEILYDNKSLKGVYTLCEGSVTIASPENRASFLNKKHCSLQFIKDFEAASHAYTVQRQLLPRDFPRLLPLKASDLPRKQCLPSIPLSCRFEDILVIGDSNAKQLVDAFNRAPAIKKIVTGNIHYIAKDNVSMKQMVPIVSSRDLVRDFTSNRYGPKLVIFRSIVDFIQFHYSTTDWDNRLIQFTYDYSNPVQAMMSTIRSSFPKSVFVLSPFHPLHVSNTVSNDPYGLKSWFHVLRMLQVRFTSQTPVLQLPCSSMHHPGPDTLSRLNGINLLKEGNDFLARLAILL